MKWSIQELHKKKDNQCSFDERIDLKDELMNRDSSIIDMSPIHVTGQLLIEPDDYLVLAHVSCQVTLPSTRSLQPVQVPLEFDFDEMYMTKEQDHHRPEALQDELVLVLENDTIDLYEAVADQILLNFPLQVLTQEEQDNHIMPSGNGWEVISEEDYYALQDEQKQNTVDPRLAKLASLFDDEK